MPEPSTVGRASTNSRRRKGIVAATLAVSMLATVPAAEASQGFRDDDGSVHEAAIEAISGRDITKGCNPPANTDFCPDDPVTRAQMATFLVRAVGLSDGTADDFEDTGSSVHRADIVRLAAAGITKGCNPPANTRFCPDRAVTRGEMATFIVRAFDLEPATPVGFTDTAATVHRDAIDRLAAAGITKGCNPPANTRFCPDRAVTRGEMATFLSRALGLPLSAPGFEVGNEHAALVERYHVVKRRDGTDEISVRRMQYWPRSFAKGLDIDPDHSREQIVDSPGRYAGWDALSPSTEWEFKNATTRDDWMHLTLRRPARVGVVWRDGIPLPGWLSGWEEGGTVAIDGDLVPVYEKSFSAGEVQLGTVEFAGEWREMYLLLLAETDGTPTPSPPAPAGFTAAKPNKPCPAWAHDRFRVPGADGAPYNTWHPQIDPVYWCYFGHEHGSDPALIPGAPLVGYGYVAAHVPQDEPDPGFKEFIFQDLSGEHWVRFVVHAGTAGGRRVCARFHTLYVEVYDAAGTLEFHAGFKNDYGAAFATSDTGSGVLTPATCGYSMASLAAEVDRLQNRSLNVGASSNNYERWDSRHETHATLNLGMVRFDHEFDIRNPMSHCASQSCNSVVVRDPEWENGTRRTLSMASWRSDFIFDADHALATGDFYTDPYGEALVDPSAGDAVWQYVEPGFSLGFFKNLTAKRIECVASDPWTFDYVCHQIGGAGNLEHLPRVPDMNIERSLWRN